MSHLHVIVVGAGLSGIATAISCTLAGHRVTVLESAKELAETGAGLQITPNSSRLLRGWDLEDSLWRNAAEPTYLSVRRYSDGATLAMGKAFNKNMRDRYGAPFLDLHRVDLQRALYNRAVSLGVIFEFNQKAESIDFDTPEVTTASGAKFRSDLIVAADGLWSRCRDCFVPENGAPLPTGDLAYRVVLSLDQIKDPELREWVSNPSVNFWIGPKAHAVAYSLRGGEMFNIVLLVPDDLPASVSRQSGSVEEMKALFSGWDPVLSKFLDIVQQVDKWKLMHRQELVSWVSDNGDACHPMLPYLAQGANSAIEDGAVLGYLLGKIETKKQIPQALKLYEQLRKARGETIAKETFKQRQAFHMPDGPEQEVRDELFLSQLNSGPTGDPFPSRWTCPQVQPWLYGYDAYAEVEEALKRAPILEVDDEISSQRGHSTKDKVSVKEAV
ncbi:Uncharacterized protein BP5553_09583 [Venustampulla echinocandica]|uniref:FAD-binding domain-containing protein n=1 Tax=Venustampulla echinocandica TaxID=2656787 RepID=A0A370TBE5_9HELO|nr:Uncharacterized protein BP5553_09583 [Venustampulla echinocandica]RDL31374.1 Uncharacterized protein BP5553_09583 [Venustampulla echinocandica]